MRLPSIRRTDKPSRHSARGGETPGLDHARRTAPPTSGPTAPAGPSFEAGDTLTGNTIGPGPGAAGADNAGASSSGSGEDGPGHGALGGGAFFSGSSDTSAFTAIPHDAGSYGAGQYGTDPHSTGQYGAQGLGGATPAYAADTDPYGPADLGSLPYEPPPPAPPGDPGEHPFFDDVLEEDEYDPYARELRTERRRFLLPMPIKLVVALAVGLCFLVVGDRWATLYAENQAEKTLQKAMHLQAEPEVHMRGFPFLTQLADQHLDDVEVTIPHLPAGRISISKVQASAHDVQLVGDSPTSLKGAVLGKAQGHALLTFDDLKRELGSSQVRYTKETDHSVRAVGKLKIAGYTVKPQAEVHLNHKGSQVISTRINDMRMSISDVGTYVPGKKGGFVLAPKLAKELSKDERKAKALLSVPYIAKKLGFSKHEVHQARKGKQAAQELQHKPEFREILRKDPGIHQALLHHPAVLQTMGLSKAVIDKVQNLKIPTLSDQFSFSVQVPNLPGNVDLNKLQVTKRGVEADITGSELPFGKTKD